MFPEFMLKSLLEIKIYDLNQIVWWLSELISHNLHCTGHETHSNKVARNPISSTSIQFGKIELFFCSAAVKMLIESELSGCWKLLILMREASISNQTKHKMYFVHITQLSNQIFLNNFYFSAAKAAQEMLMSVRPSVRPYVT